MCGRYVLYADETELKKRYDLADVPFSYSESYNITPESHMPIIVETSPRRAVNAKWGLVPHWSKEPKTKFSTINARVETADTSPVYRTAFAKNRCLVPANGFYEWKKDPDSKAKTPYYFYSENEDVLSFAGLFDIWKDAEGHALYTFTILTKPPNDVVKKVHTRMPAVLAPDEETEWFGISDVNNAKSFIMKEHSIDLYSYRVNSMVNNPQNDSPQLIAQS